jgi:hypothetical protein
MFRPLSESPRDPASAVKDGADQRLDRLHGRKRSRVGPARRVVRATNGPISTSKSIYLAEREMTAVLQLTSGRPDRCGLRLRVSKRRSRNPSVLFSRGRTRSSACLVNANWTEGRFDGSALSPAEGPTHSPLSFQRDHLAGSAETSRQPWARRRTRSKTTNRTGRAAEVVLRLKRLFQVQAV